MGKLVLEFKSNSVFTKAQRQMREFIEPYVGVHPDSPLWPEESQDTWVQLPENDSWFMHVLVKEMVQNDDHQRTLEVTICAYPHFDGQIDYTHWVRVYQATYTCAERVFDQPVEYSPENGTSYAWDPGQVIVTS